MKLSMKLMIYLGSDKMQMLPIIVFAVMVGGVSIGEVGFAKGKGKPASKSSYGDSFSKPGIASELPEDAAASSIGGVLLEVPSLNSFPVRIQVEGNDVHGWDQPDNVGMPAKIARTFKFGNCQFELKSGDFSVRHYNSENPEQLQVLADAVMPQSTFSTSISGQVLFSLTTSLSVSVDEKNKSTCKDSIGSRMLYIGRPSLEGSTLYGVGESGDAVNASVFRQETPGKIFVSWNREANQITLLDNSGMVPEIETSVYSLSFESKDNYYLGFDYSFKLKKDKSKVAKNKN